MIYYDVTKMGSARQKSGMTRTSSRLLREFGTAVMPVAWDARRRAWVAPVTRAPVTLLAHDWLLTVEVFSEAERPGFLDFVTEHPCRLAGMFYDAIPVRFPHITWPQSVQRHPEYMKLLACFDHVVAISDYVAHDLTAFWRWQGVTPLARVASVRLGADFDGSPRVTVPVAPAAGARPALLCVGIIEPRKNQAFLLEVAERLWAEGLDFDLHVAGRVNPHFGGPIARRLRQAAKREGRLHYHAAPDDAVLNRLYGAARAVVFPTIAEGNGLPILEAAWRGVPCVCSDLPVLRENTAGGGSVLAAVNDPEVWRRELRAVVTDEALAARLRAEAVSRELPTWAGTAREILAALG